MSQNLVVLFTLNSCLVLDSYNTSQMFSGYYLQITGCKVVRASCLVYTKINFS